MKHPLALPWILLHFRGTAGYFSTVECPRYSSIDIKKFHEFDSSTLHDCTLLISREDPHEIYSKNSHIRSGCPEANKFHDDDYLFDYFTNNKDESCTIKLKVTMMRNWSFDSSMENPCLDSSAPSLLPVSGNCSLFYKCDWGSAILFECPSDLHFNAELQVCDWPWQAQCDISWKNCPRPNPRCPVNYPRPLYLPHPRLCDKFYQCDWGVSHLQACPAGLHFDPKLKICDWPRRANCQVC